MSVHTGLCVFFLSLSNNSQVNRCCYIKVRVWEMYHVEQPIKKRNNDNKKKKVQCYRSVTKHHVNTAFIRLEIHFERLTNLLSNVYRSSLSSPLLPVLHFFFYFFLTSFLLTSALPLIFNQSHPPIPTFSFSFILLPSLCPPAVAPCHLLSSLTYLSSLSLLLISCSPLLLFACSPLCQPNRSFAIHLYIST